ncbi:MAG: DUF2141 domain-containing protein [Pseudomonadota bacterium]
MKRCLIPFFTILIASLGAGKASAQGVNLTVEGVRNDRGQIVVLIFDDAEAFEYLAYEWAVGYAALPAQPGSLSYGFADLTSGPYAIFVYHDENSDWDVNYSGDRLLEGIGASGAPNPDDMPDFAAASVATGLVTVTLHYDE